MVARISSGRSIRGILVYNEDKVNKGEAKVVLASGFATEIDKLSFHQRLFRFEQLTMLNSRSKVNAMHISLNFHADDRLDAGKMQQIASVYMEKIGLGDQPYIAYEHLDSAHPHLHIATVLIERDGKRISTEGIGRKLSEPARKDLEVKYGLVKAEGRKLSNEPYLRAAEYGVLPTKKQLNNITKVVMRDYAYTSFAEYKAVLAQFNVHVDRGFEDSVMFEKKGLVYSIVDASGKCVGVPFKASVFYQGATMNRIEQHFEENKVRRLGSRQELQNRIDGVLDKYDLVSKPTMLKALAAEQVALVFRQNENGLIYGATFIDHKNRAVFNGSDLGKGYSAKAIVEKLAPIDEPKRFLDKVQSQGFLDKNLGPGDWQSRGGDNLLDGLLAQADFDPIAEVARKKKKKPGMGKSNGM